MTTQRIAGLLSCLKIEHHQFVNKKYIAFIGPRYIVHGGITRVSNIKTTETEDCML